MLLWLPKQLVACVYFDFNVTYATGIGTDKLRLNVVEGTVRKLFSNDLLFKDARLDSMVLDVGIAVNVKRVTSLAVSAVSRIE